MKKPSKTLAGYPAFLGEIKHRIQSARHSVARAVNRDLILLYWDIGRAIRERQVQLGWGESVVEALAADLRKAFQGAAGFSARNLRNMKQFHEAYSSPLFWQQAVAKLAVSPQEAKFWQQPVAKLSLAKRMEFFRQAVADIPWGHHLLILNRISDPTARLYYLRATAQFGWSRNLLLNQIKARSYERSQAKGKVHNFPAALPGALAELAEQALKSSYSLEFLGIKHELRERDLEQRLLERLRGFILELGYGFCFIGNQYRLELGRKEYFIDLLFYHRFLKALVAVELKLGAFEPEHAGKMDFYLNLLNEKERAPDDNLSIGIILCAEKDNHEVEFSLKTKRNPIGVAEYQLVPNLPRELQGKLPSARALRALLRAELPSQTRPKIRAIAIKKLSSRRHRKKPRQTVATSR